MTNQKKIELLTSNIHRAEDRARREIETGNDFGYRSNIEFADMCRAELKLIKSQ